MPPDLEALILECLQKDPGRRPPNATEIAKRLVKCEIPRPWGVNDAQEWWDEHGTLFVAEQSDLLDVGPKTVVRRDLMDRASGLA